MEAQGPHPVDPAFDDRQGSCSSGSSAKGERVRLGDLRLEGEDVFGLVTADECACPRQRQTGTIASGRTCSVAVLLV
jgi:hypothetical protein